ncbi:MAG TPA: ABC-2 family transporter protein, partial [Microlunatus sp.]|nr:ABC-2 family transporter protein [Microlunatus sp.]
EIAVDLARPVDLYFSWWARDLGRAAFTLPARGLPPFLVGAVLMGVALPTTPASYLLGVISVLLAASISFTIRFLINLAAFWVIDVRGLIGVMVVVTSFFCGLYVPVHLFPDWLRVVAYATPFPSILQFPIDVLSGRAEGLAGLQTIGVQAAWLAGLVLLSRIVLFRASRRLVVQGG